MDDVTNVQAEIMAQLQALLSDVPGFGGDVREDTVQRLILDAEDTTLPDQLIVLQEGDTVEVERSPTTMKEELTVNVVAMSRSRGHGALLRVARLDIKRRLKGMRGGVEAKGLVSASFPPSSSVRPESGRRWAFRVIPITFTYVQQL